MPHLYAFMSSGFKISYWPSLEVDIQYNEHHFIDIFTLLDDTKKNSIGLQIPF